MKILQNKLTQRELKRVLKYDKETGIFTWKKLIYRNDLKGTEAGGLNNSGYSRIFLYGKRYLAHRLAFLYVLGYLPENDVDHINRIKNDNRWENLREATTSCNCRNSSKRKLNKSGITGVHFSKRENKWVAQICDEGKHKYLGAFKTIGEAATARFEAEVKYGYQSCDINSTAKQYLEYLRG